MKLAVVLVHYHTPELLAEAVTGIRSELGRPPLEALASEVVVVDNGSRPEARAALAALPVRLLRPERNRGYAGGLNLGVGSTDAELLVLANPDVELERGCLASLVETLEGGAQVAGPRCFWDREHRFLMPPADAQGRVEELLRALAERSGRLRKRARRRWRRHARRHWQAQTAIESFALTGALLCLRRAAWERVGPFDEGYRLYFEETDWLCRARRLGVDSRYVPSASAVHRYAQSSAREPQAASWFAESAARFRRRHYGVGFTRLLERLAGGRASVPEGEPPCREPVDLSPYLGRQPAWIEVSPSPLGFPAVGEPIADRRLDGWSFPRALIAGQGLATLRVCLTDRAGRELAAWRLRVDQS